MPTGIGVEIDASVVKGGGFLRVMDTQIAGALELSIALGSLELSVQAFGVIQQINGELSFVVVMSVEFSPPIEIFLGLTLNAVGGVFGFNRTVDSPALRDLVARRPRQGRPDPATISSPGPTWCSRRSRRCSRRSSGSTWPGRSWSSAGAVRSRSSR